MTGALYVYLQHSLAGHLWLDAQKYLNFQYHQDWLGSEESIPISLSLPLTAEPYENDKARPFFTNLLPEANIRRTISKNLGISTKNDFALLQAIGGECAGAISVWPSEMKSLPPGGYRSLPEIEFGRLLDSMPAHPILMGGEGIRLSLAGAQNKTPVYRKANEFYLPEGTASSSHILKPQIRGLSDTVENETFCMKLASAIGTELWKVFRCYRPQVCECSTRSNELASLACF